ncbi:MAG: discoidin domain-containing protein, partial [Oscillospiraceae bacterium]|nr:discoidin domain-containing protein [Oscillospiraceae bacterium]
MQKRIFGIMLAAVFLLPIIGGIVPVSGAGSDEPLYSISFDYELASSSALFKLCFNRYNGADTNNYLSWQFAENSVWPQRRGRSSVLSAYSFRNLGGGGTPFDGSAFEGPINVKIDVFSTYIETYVNGTLLRTDTFTDINTQNAYGASISAISTTVGLISTSANGTAYIDNLVVINGGASPSMKYYADFESENPFDGVGTSLEDGWLRIANISGGTSDSTVRWINEALATPPPGGVLQFYYDLYCKLNLNDYKSWSIAQFEDAMALAKNVIENSSSTQQEQNDAVAALIAAHGLLYGKNDVLNLRNYDQFRQDGTYNVALGKDVTVNSSTDIAVVPDYYYDFTKSADVAKFSVKNACTFVYNSDSGAFGRFTATGSDAYMLYSIPANEQFSADDYPYIAISQKNNSDKTSGDIFFGTTVNPGPAGPDRTSYPISAHDTDYVKIIIYMPEQNMGYSDEPQYQWTGFVNAFRMNVLSQGAANGDTCDLKYVAFFKTYEDAVAFDGVFPLASQPSNDPKVLANGLVGGNASNTWQITEDECVATVDLGAEYQIESVALFPRQDSGVTVNSALGFPLSYTIDFSTDGTTYFGAINEAGKTAATVKANPQFSSLSSPITVRYVRINMNETQEGKDYFALSEIAVYGKGGFVDMGNRDLYIPSVVDGWNPAFPMQAMHPDDGSLLPLDITWVSGDESVITVDTNGHVTAVGFGTTTLTAYDNKFGITAVWTVNVLVGQDKTGITDRIIISAFFQPLLPPHGPGIDDEAYRMMAECGIDLIENCHSAGQTSYEQNRQIAELCAKYGMWLLVNDIPQPVVSNDEWILMNYSQQQLEEYVNKWMDVPGVGGFYLADEPPT